MLNQDRPVFDFHVGELPLRGHTIPISNDFVYCNYQGVTRNRVVGDHNILPTNPMNRILEDKGILGWSNAHV